MKTFEILRNDIDEVDEQSLADKLAKFDWRYEYNDDPIVQRRAQNQLIILENLVYKFWKNNPTKAISLWNNYSNLSKKRNNDLMVTPSFIFRLEAQEKYLDKV